MNFAGKINVGDNVPELRIRSLAIGLQIAFYYRYYYGYYSLQTMVGEEISS